MRWTLAALMAFDAVVVSALLWPLAPSAVTHPAAPAWLLAIGTSHGLIVGCAALAVVGALGFARKADQPAWALLSLLGVGVLVEAQAALLEGPMRFLFFSGAALLGWLAGLGFARAAGLPPQEREGFARAGALGALAACYLGAVSSKLLSSGVDWVLDTGLQSTIASQHAWGRSGLLDAFATFVLEHRVVAQALAAFTVVAQAGAVLLPFPGRGRRVAVVLLLLFHAGVWLLTPISFPQAMVLLVALGWPPERESALLAREARRPLALLSLAALIGVAVAWLPPLRAYTALHHARPRPAVQGAPAPEAPLVTVAGLPVGLDVAGFRVVALGRGEGDVTWVRLERAPEVLVVELLPPGAREGAPARSRRFELFYLSARPGEVAPSGASVGALLRGVAGALDSAQ